mgnify:CR=1 FL=1
MKINKRIAKNIKQMVACIDRISIDQYVIDASHYSLREKIEARKEMKKCFNQFFDTVAAIKKYSNCSNQKIRKIVNSVFSQYYNWEYLNDFESEEIHPDPITVEEWNNCNTKWDLVNLIMNIINEPNDPGPYYPYYSSTKAMIGMEF